LSIETSLVWLKRDLRVRDHKPLAAALQAGPTVALYVFEPSMMSGEDHAPMHTRFCLDALSEMQSALALIHVPLLVFVGEVIDALEQVCRPLSVSALYSHEETGNLQSYARDRAVRRWARAHALRWHEFWQNGVQRPHPKREGWAGHWEQRMSLPCVAVPKSPIPPVFGEAATDLLTRLGRVPSLSELAPHFAHLRENHATQATELVAGHSAAEAMLTSFLDARGRTFRTAISSPTLAWTAGSRLSPYLAYGNLSLREVVQRARARLSQVREAGDSLFAASLESFLSRLAWHCHFMQKLEDEPALEVSHAHPGMQNLRNEGALSFEEDRRLRAWKLGKTGQPLVDAVMRCLRATGWVNFRMRAMLVSYASYDLWLHWRPVALHLAQNFIDYEPGIHYPQVQMQAGTTGTNTLRMYDPGKQLRDWDPEGLFVKRWVPELAALPSAMLQAPFRMSRDQQKRYGVWIGKDYPAPLVLHAQAIRKAKAKFESQKLMPHYREQAQAVFERHGSRRRLKGSL
jgi:deoxyribodipyrimidine photo-lyase